LARGLVGLTRTKGKLDPKKLTAVALGLSALESASQQRRAERALQEAMKAEQQWWQSTLTPMQQMTNMLMGYGFQFLMPWMFPPQTFMPPQQAQQQTQQRTQQQFPPFLFPMP